MHLGIFVPEMRFWVMSLNLALMVSDRGGCYNMTKLPCQAHLEQGLNYRKISWYKIGEGVTGLVLKNLNTNKTILYKSANHSYQIGDDLSLILPPSAFNDCGEYHCTLWPPVGHQIREGDSSFYPPGCSKPKEPQLIKVPRSRLSSSAQQDSVVCAMTGGMAALGVLLLTRWIREGPADSHSCFQDAASHAFVDKSSGMERSISCAALL
ncbi:hypothetical protein AAFF_G00090850 [Aldrovandia affinis]|uniref:Ig-like domain-containing protein n=1 Tax=Aldrovandia affinis TaxID=143900 RepID=A0AAD7RVW2_9TELE|nr:hypothetical protein AAFF_G00090850 [Aldrovandia affinis]